MASSLNELTTNNGIITHPGSGKSAHYGQMASIAANLDVPKEVTLKDAKEYKIIGHSKKNVDGHKIVTGEPLFGIDTDKEGMLIAMLVHAPAFGKTLGILKMNLS